MSKTPELTPQILAMYLGCQFKFGKPLPYSLVHSHNLSWQGEYTLTVQYLALLANRLEIVDVKPILRRLESMTFDTAKEIDVEFWTDFTMQYAEYLANTNWPKTWRTRFTPKEFSILLSKHFDLFGLIDAQLAIEKK